MIAGRAGIGAVASAAFAGMVWLTVQPVEEVPGAETSNPWKERLGYRIRWADVRLEPPDDSAVSGERVYGWYCLPCHGPEGKGDGPMAQRLGIRPRDFTRGLFKLKTSPPGEMPFEDDLYRTVTAGLPAAGMPAFADFSAAERWALVEYLKSFSPHFRTQPARTRLSFLPPAGLDPNRGARLFREMQCITCHGPRGRGDGPAGAGLQGGVPDWTREDRPPIIGMHVEDVFRVLTIGIEGTPMPSFGSLSERDRWDLAAFVTTLYGSHRPK